MAGAPETLMTGNGNRLRHRSSDDKDNAKTLWATRDIWTRRSFTLQNIPAGKLFLKLHHDDDNVEVYLNARKIYSCNCWNGKPEYFEIAEFIKKGIAHWKKCAGDTTVRIRQEEPDSSV